MEVRECERIKPPIGRNKYEGICKKVQLYKRQGQRLLMDYLKYIMMGNLIRIIYFCQLDLEQIKVVIKFISGT